MNQLILGDCLEVMKNMDNNNSNQNYFIKFVRLIFKTWIQNG